MRIVKPSEIDYRVSYDDTTLDVTLSFDGESILIRMNAAEARTLAAELIDRANGLERKR